MMRDEPRKPAWLKIDLSSTDSYSHTSHTITSGGLHTICASGKCPNRAECWSHGTATFMIGGNYCTRRCRFCATAYMSKPPALNPDEPESVARSVREMGLRYAVITSVDRDDLEDSGAAHWAETIRAIRRLSPETKIEVLIPDFRWDMSAIDTVLKAGPDVVGHNVETVRRLTPHVRYRATYDGSLAVLRHVAEQGFIAKTGIMLGLGETEEEVLETICIFRLACPTAFLRYSGGRALLSPETERMGLYVGINSAITGGLLTTVASVVSRDRELFHSAGYDTTRETEWTNG